LEHREVLVGDPVAAGAIRDGRLPDQALEDLDAELEDRTELVAVLGSWTS
jgi:hypothetical protein